MRSQLLKSDENPNLHGQAGCVAGIFHAFSRHRLHSSRRLTNLHHRNPFPGAPIHLEENSTGASSKTDPIQADEVTEASSGESPESMAAAGEGTRRPAGVVAKLMGLESLPEISSEKRNFPLRRVAPARLPVEKAPWNRHVSVYCEAESKLKDLDLDQSNRDLRALKHILKSMQKKAESEISIVKPAIRLEEESGIPLGGLSGIKVSMDREKVNATGKSGKNMEEKSQRVKVERKAQLPERKSSGHQTAKVKQYRFSEVDGELGKKSAGEDFPGEIAAISLDQPSPVSVLDASFHEDDQPLSPVSKNSHSFRAGGEQEHNQNFPLRAFTAAIQKKFKSIDKLLEKLDQLGCNGDGDHIALLCEKRTPDHRYVSEVLLASGFLLNPDLHLHYSSTFPLNPDLFLVLEQTRSRGRSPNSAKLRRRLLFDAINEILIEKMKSTTVCCEDHLPARKILREICSEIENLESCPGVERILREEVDRRWRWWIAGGEEIDGVVLDIERFIFKTLIDEVVAGGAVFLASVNRNRRRRRLFSPIK